MEYLVIFEGMLFAIRRLIMGHVFGNRIFTVVLLICFSASATAKEKSMDQTTQDRAKVDDAFKWKLEDLYHSIADWEKDLKVLEKEMKDFSKCKGKLSRGALRLAKCLDSKYDTVKRFKRLEGYATRLHDQDAADTKGQELFDRMTKVGTELQTATSWVEPEILAIAPRRLKAMLRTKALAKYRHTIDNIVRRRAHILSKEQEAVIARVGDLAAVPESVYSTLSTLNLPFPEVTLKSGKKVRITQAMYTKFRAAADRDDRLKVFHEFWNTYESFKETMAALLAGVVSRDHYYARVHKYDSDLASALDSTGVPTSIYTNMIKQIKAARPLLWRYLKLRKKLLGLDELGYEDLYTSIVPSVELNYSWQQAKETILKALAPMGKDYVEIMKKCFDDRWADVYPTKGKRSGAYMAGSAYDVHPYVLLNYNGDYESMSTAAHEFGHAGHSYLSNKYQPFHYSRYPIFTAEVASTANENLLRLYVTNQEKDPKKKLFLLGQYLESWRTTVFRQCIFAEFELKIHQMAAEGKALTADLLNETYLKLLREYYGEQQGIVKIDPLYSVEWAYIPHFYYDFYMFQYTTSFIASTAVAQKVFSGDKAGRDAYLSMLKAGGSKYPVELLKMAGVDMTTDKPYKVAFKALEKALDEAEALIH